MTPKATPNPPRLAERRSTGDRAQDLAGELMRTLQPPPQMHPAAEARLERRLAAAGRPRRRAPRWAVALAGLSVLLVGGVVAAKRGGAPWRRLVAIVRPLAPPPSARQQPRPAHRPLVLPTPAVEPARGPGPPAAAAPVDERPAPRSARPRLALREAPAPAATPTAPAAPRSPLADESALLGRAVAQLRDQGGAAAAVATLDEYDTRFPHGMLAFDALAARVDALVRLGRRADALARLERVPPATLDRSAALRVLRGELRAGAGRLAPAIQDFDAALALGGGDDLAGRALYGRGSCRARLGDAPGARADLERYLQLFPRGRFAAEASKALGR